MNSTSAQPDNATPIWKWKPIRWWVFLIIFWLVATIGAGLVARGGGTPNMEGCFVIMVLLSTAIFTAFTDRGWKIPLRIVWVIGVWLIHAVALVPASFLAVLASKPHLVERTAALLAAIPLLLWAMRRSTFFVKRVTASHNEEDFTGA